MRTLHVASAQIHSGGTVEENLKRVEKQVKAASVLGVDVILFAECALCGYDYDMDATSTKRHGASVNGKHCRQVSALAKKYKLVILIGLIEKSGGKYYNSHLVAYPDGTRLVQRKHVLTKGEKRAKLTQGREERTIFTINGVRCAILICADSSIKDVHRKMQQQNVEYYFHPCGGGGKIQDMLHEADLTDAAVRKTYRENRKKVFVTTPFQTKKRLPFIGVTTCNALGPVGKQTCHQGHLVIVDKNRVIRAQVPGTIVLEHMQDQMIHAELNID